MKEMKLNFSVYILHALHVLDGEIKYPIGPGNILPVRAGLLSARNGNSLKVPKSWPGH